MQLSAQMDSMGVSLRRILLLESIGQYLGIFSQDGYAIGLTGWH
jgi:hypothetical protein